MPIPRVLRAAILCAAAAANGSAQTNIAADATATASSQLDSRYPPPNAIDGVVSDVSRWLSANVPDAKWLTLAMPETRAVGGFVLYSGYEDTAAIGRVRAEQLDAGAWVSIPSSVVTGNTNQVLVVRFDQTVETSALRFVFEDAGIVRVREIVVWAPGDEPPAEPGPGTPSDPAIFVNQSGYNLDEPKRFTAVNLPDGTAFTVRTRSGVPAFAGTIQGGIGDFTPLNPATEEEFIVHIGALQSDPFRIGPWWLERVTYQRAVDFMVDARNRTGNVKTPASSSYSWRDDHHFGYSLRSLVDQFLSNPAAYERMPRQIVYEAPRDNAWGALAPCATNAPDIIKMIHWGADVIVTQGLTHEMMKSELAYFLYAWPWLRPWMDSQNYDAVKAFALAQWTNSTITAAYPYDESPANGHNLLETKTKTGSTKGAYPPGFSLLPNTLLALALDRDADPFAAVCRDAARAQAAWITANLDAAVPQVTKGQRMSENFLLMGLAAFARLDPGGVPSGFDDFIRDWADVAIRRSTNLWDFRRLTDTGAWTPYNPSVPTQWNEPGNVAGFPAAALEAAGLLTDPAQQSRLKQLAWAAFDNMFGRNPTGRHFSYDGPIETEGVERGWYSFYPGGIGQLRNVRFVLDGAPKDAHYPYHPEQGNIGWTEGWVSFNTAFNRALAVLAFQSTRLELHQPGDRFLVRLTAPLHFNALDPQTATLRVTTSRGDAENVVLQPASPYARALEGAIPASGGEGAPTADNGLLEVLAGDTVRASYGYGYFERTAALTATTVASRDSDGDGLEDAWEIEHFATLAAVSGGTLTLGDGVSAQVEMLADLDPRRPNTQPLAAVRTVDALGEWLEVRWRETRRFPDAEVTALELSGDLEHWTPAIFDGIHAVLVVENPDPDGNGRTRAMLARLRIPEGTKALFTRLAPALAW